MYSGDNNSKKAQISHRLYLLPEIELISLKKNVQEG